MNLSFVVIGLNEGAKLGACLASLRAADLAGLRTEILYVDGGSHDDSIAIAQAAGADQVLGGERRRRAAENRNLGLAHAQGEFVQFVDGDMTLFPDWPKRALAVMAARPEVAVVWGRMEETQAGTVYDALELDWEFAEGPSRYCGGAALFRRDTLRAFGGFPEEVAYGEEPYLCWRMRHEGGHVVWHLHAPMVRHDLDYRGFADYWRRNVRCGATFAEIAARCWRGPERLWLREVLSNLVWSAGLVALLAAVLAAPGPWRAGAALALAAIVARKFLQFARRGVAWRVALLYAVHTYFSKLPIGWGIVRWGFGRLAGARRTAPAPAG